MTARESNGAVRRVMTIKRKEVKERVVKERIDKARPRERKSDE
jgi:hypothetical protein